MNLESRVERNGVSIRLKKTRDSELAAQYYEALVTRVRNLATRKAGAAERAADHCRDLTMSDLPRHMHVGVDPLYDDRNVLQHMREIEPMSEEIDDVAVDYCDDDLELDDYNLTVGYSALSLLGSDDCSSDERYDNLVETLDSIDIDFNPVAY